MSTIYADKVLSKLTEFTGLTEAGKAWLTAAIDPFHDEQIKHLDGFPDGMNSASVVQVIRSSKTFTAPVADRLWDCNIISYPSVTGSESTFGWTPIMVDSLTAAGSFDANIFLTQNSAPASFHNFIGGLAVYTGLTDSALSPFNFQIEGTSYTFSPANSYTDGNYRIIAKGYEVTSSGPDLYKSGNVFAWQQPSPSSPDIEPLGVMILNTTTGAVSQSFSTGAKTYDYPPRNSGEAMTIPSTKCWLAKDGAYMVDRLMGEANFSVNGSTCSSLYTGPVKITSGTTTLTECIGNTTRSPSVQLPNFTGPTTVPCMGTSDSTNFGHSGLFFKGLSPSDVLTVNVIWYIERFPTNVQPDLIVLARPSPPLDPIALDIYSLLASNMPVGDIAKSNGFGDWFKEAVGVIADTIAPAMSALPGPVGMAAKAITIGGKLLNGSSKKESEALQYSPAPVPQRDIVPAALYETPRGRPHTEIIRVVESKNPTKKKHNKSSSSLPQIASHSKNRKSKQ